MSQSQSEFSFTIPESIYYLHIPILLRRFIFRLLLLILCIWFVQYDDEASIILTTEEGCHFIQARISYLMYVKYET